MDIRETITPRSDQLNFDDLLAGSFTGTVETVSKGTAEQPVNVNLKEFPGRAYKPSKSMRRVLVAGWGAESNEWVGRTLELVGNPEITFGRDKVGGIEIAAMSHLEKPLVLSLTATRGRRKSFTVQPLTAPTDTTGRDWLTELDNANTLAAIETLGAEAKSAHVADPIIQKMYAKHADVKAGSQ